MFGNFFHSLLGKRKSSDEEEEDISEYHDAEAGDDAGGESDGSSEGWNQEDEDHEDEEDNMEAPPEISASTLAQQLTHVLPDADITCPNVIIVGGQSAGKTKMIISLVFHYLIDNAAFTDAMGEKLLRIFRTGNKMVTRRPTTVEFKKAPMPSDPCVITVSLGNRSATYSESDSTNFDSIVEEVHDETLVRDGRAYGEEFKVVVSAPSLPNISFTDLPGLITDDRVLADAAATSPESQAAAAMSARMDDYAGEGMRHQDLLAVDKEVIAADRRTIRHMVQSYMVRPDTTLVVVEPASIEDFETSQVSPLLRDIKRSGKRPDIFEHAVLVLSKCDKIRQGYESRIVKLFELTSPQLKDFPYKHVVGVVNKKDDPEHDGIDDKPVLTFADFKVAYKDTKQHEADIFSHYRCSPGTANTTTSAARSATTASTSKSSSRGGGSSSKGDHASGGGGGGRDGDSVPCSTTTQCTTSAVFHQMDQISFEMVCHSLQGGRASVERKIVALEQQIRKDLAPPLWFYDQQGRDSNSQSNHNSQSSQSMVHSGSQPASPIQQSCSQQSGNSTASPSSSAVTGSRRRGRRAAASPSASASPSAKPKDRKKPGRGDGRSKATSTEDVDAEGDSAAAAASSAAAQSAAAQAQMQQLQERARAAAAGRTVFLRELRGNLAALLSEALKMIHPYDSLVRQAAEESAQSRGLVRNRNIINNNNSSSSNNYYHNNRSCGGGGMDEEADDDEPLAIDKPTFILVELNRDWPDFRPGDMDVSTQQQKALLALRSFYTHFITERVSSTVITCLTDPDQGCFSQAHSPFNRVDRYPKLCQELRRFVQRNLRDCMREAKDKVARYLQHQWDYEVPRGVGKERFYAMFDELFHVSIRTIYHSLLRVSSSSHLEEMLVEDAVRATAFAPLQPPQQQSEALAFGSGLTGSRSTSPLPAASIHSTLFQERPEFVKRRRELQGKWKHLQQQCAILGHVMHATSNEQLRKLLEEAHGKETGQQQDETEALRWAEFWKQAQQLHEQELQETAAKAAATAATASNRAATVAINATTTSTAATTAAGFASCGSPVRISERFSLTPGGTPGDAPGLDNSSNSSGSAGSGSQQRPSRENSQHSQHSHRSHRNVQYAAAPYDFRLPSTVDEEPSDRSALDGADGHRVKRTRTSPTQQQPYDQYLQAAHGVAPTTLSGSAFRGSPTASPSVVAALAVGGSSGCGVSVGRVAAGGGLIGDKSPVRHLAAAASSMVNSATKMMMQHLHPVPTSSSSSYTSATATAPPFQQRYGLDSAGGGGGGAASPIADGKLPFPGSAQQAPAPARASGTKIKGEAVAYGSVSRGSREYKASPGEAIDLTHSDDDDGDDDAGDEVERREGEEEDGNVVVV